MRKRGIEGVYVFNGKYAVSFLWGLGFLLFAGCCVGRLIFLVRRSWRVGDFGFVCVAIGILLLVLWDELIRLVVRLFFVLRCIYITLLFSLYLFCRLPSAALICARRLQFTPSQAQVVAGFVLFPFSLWLLGGFPC